MTASRVRVQDIVIWFEHRGMTPDEIVSHIPTITLAEVHSAAAYYLHRQWSSHLSQSKRIRER